MSVQFTLRLRNGEKKILSEPVGYTDGEVDLAVLHKAISKVQEKANDLLTVCVEEQKLQNNRGAIEGNEDDRDEDEESDNEPEEKKPKKMTY